MSVCEQLCDRSCEKSSDRPKYKAHCCLPCWHDAQRWKRSGLVKVLQKCKILYATFELQQGTSSLITATLHLKWPWAKLPSEDFCLSGDQWEWSAGLGKERLSKRKVLAGTVWAKEIILKRITIRSVQTRIYVRRRNGYEYCRNR